jgi:hypothetical protein
MEALHKDGEDGGHHKIGGMVMEFMVEPFGMETTMILMAILFTIWYDHICACDVYFLALLFDLCLTCGGCFVTIE